MKNNQTPPGFQEIVNFAIGIGWQVVPIKKSSRTLWYLQRPDDTRARVPYDSEQDAWNAIHDIMLGCSEEARNNS